VLVVVKNGDIHPLAESLLDLKAFRGFDILQIDPAERWLHGGNGLDDGVGVSEIKLDIKDIDVGKPLEENALAFHNGFGGLRADIAEPEDGRAV
jgi:hypothetical protein